METSLPKPESSGIRAILKVSKRLNTVRGRLCIVHPRDFVEQTLSTSGFQMWLEKGYPDDMPSAGDTGDKRAWAHSGIQYYVMDEEASLTVSELANWRPWQPVDEGRVQTMVSSRDAYGLGIGSAAARLEEGRGYFGEFLEVAGNVVYQPPDEQTPPDVGRQQE